MRRAGKPVEHMEDILHYIEFACKAGIMTFIVAFTWDAIHALYLGKFKKFMRKFFAQEGMGEKAVKASEYEEELSTPMKVKVALMVVGFVILFSLQIAELASDSEIFEGAEKVFHYMEFICNAGVVVGFLAVTYDVCSAFVLFIQDDRERLHNIFRTYVLCEDDLLEKDEEVVPPLQQEPPVCTKAQIPKAVVVWATMLLMFILEIVEHTSREDGDVEHHDEEGEEGEEHRRRLLSTAFRLGRALLGGEDEPALPEHLEPLEKFLGSLEALCVSGIVVAFLANANDFVAILVRGQVASTLLPTKGDHPTALENASDKALQGHPAVQNLKLLLCGGMFIMLLVFEIFEEAGKEVEGVEDFLHWVEFFCKAGLMLAFATMVFDGVRHYLKGDLKAMVYSASAGIGPTNAKREMSLRLKIKIVLMILAFITILTFQIIAFTVVRLCCWVCYVHVVAG